MLKRYFVTMAVATGLTLGRGIMLAALLPVSAFGSFAMFMSIGIFLSNLLGFGEIEATIKSFPRAVADGHEHLLLDKSDWMAMRVAKRSLLGLPCIAVAFGLQFISSPQAIMMVGALIVAVVTAWIAIYISANRAASDLVTLADTATARAVLALGFCALGALLMADLGAMIGEIVAAVLAIAYARRALKVPHHSDGLPDNNPAVLEATGGRLLLLAGLLTSMLLYLDRSFVASALGSVAAGQYAVLMIVVSGSTALYGQAAQKIGPDIIKAQHKGASLATQIRMVAPWMAAISGMIFLGVLCLIGLRQFYPLQMFFDRYEIRAGGLALAGLLGILQATSLVDWLLISRNQEKSVLVTVIGQLIVLGLAGGVMSYYGLSILNIMWCLIIAKIAQLALQFFVARFGKNRQGDSATDQGRANILP